MSCRAVAEQQAPVVRPALKVGAVNDPAEVEADAVADMVMSMSGVAQERVGPSDAPAAAPTIRRACTCDGPIRRTPDGDAIRREETDEDEEAVHMRSRPESSPSGDLDQSSSRRIEGERGTGVPLVAETRRFFEPRFGANLADVRVHDDGRAADLASSMHARAFTVGRDVFFGAGEYQPGTPDGRHLLAHELTHVLQSDRSVGAVRRTIELRPPGRGEASAFDRRQELVDRLNDISEAVTYRLDADDRTLLYEIDDATAMTEFDRKMTGFIDADPVVPLRLITSAGRVGDGTGNLVPLTADSFVLGYVDLDDLLGSSDLGFQLLLAHFITERIRVPNYARRIGTAGLGAAFNAAHARGREAEAEVLQDVLGDPSIRHHFDELKANGTTFVRAFRSADEGYRVFWVIQGHGRRAQISVTDIRVVDGTRRLTIDEFIAERAAVAP